MKLNSLHKNQVSCLAVFGTGSEVGKSIVATALCRVLLRRGIRVAPYKAQNMSNNSGVTPEGGEMGRAQIVQAEACRLAPHVDMNPILLKPTSDIGSQVVLLGRALTNSTAAEYHREKENLLSQAQAALDRLRSQYDLVVMEGAGSCAEVNLMDHDIVNFKMAEYAAAPVVLVADIHRGGVFAQIVGTLQCLPTRYREMIAGFIINRFRGDIDLFADGVRWIENQTGKPVFGVLPWYSHFNIDSEDSVVIENPGRVTPDRIDGPAVGIIRIPHISNFTDFEPLAQLSGLQIHFIEKIQDLAHFAAVILPGSKNTRYDLQWLHDTGWTDAMRTYYLEQGGYVLGICGGYQMLGTAVHDPDGIEGQPGTTAGLGLLPVDTVLKAPKTTTLSHFEWGSDRGQGYEIHMGQTRVEGGNPVFTVVNRNGRDCSQTEGCMLDNGRIIGTYIHGMFDTPAITRRWLDSIGLNSVAVSDVQGPAARDNAYELLADHFEKYMDLNRIFKFCLPHLAGAPKK